MLAKNRESPGARRSKKIRNAQAKLDCVNEQLAHTRWLNAEDLQWLVEQKDEIEATLRELRWGRGEGRQLRKDMAQAKAEGSPTGS